MLKHSSAGFLRWNLQMDTKMAFRDGLFRCIPPVVPRGYSLSFFFHTTNSWNTPKCSVFSIMSSMKRCGLKGEFVTDGSDFQWFPAGISFSGRV